MQPTRFRQAGTHSLFRSAHLHPVCQPKTHSPTLAQPLTILQHLSLKDVDELRPCVLMLGKHRARRESHQLHSPPICSPDVFHFNRWSKC